MVVLRCYSELSEVRVRVAVAISFWNQTTRSSELLGNVAHRLPVIENSFTRGVVQRGNRRLEQP